MAFRELSFAEMEAVAGGYWHSYVYYSSGGGEVWDREWIDDTPQIQASADHLTYSVGSASPQAFKEFLSQVERQYAPPPQYESGYDSGYFVYGAFGRYSDAFDWFDHGLSGFVPSDALVGSPHMNVYSATNQSGGSTSSASLSGNQFVVSVNGHAMIATYHPGSPTTQSAGDNVITVNGGHWTYRISTYSEVDTAIQTALTQSPSTATQPPVDNLPEWWDRQRDYNIDAMGLELAKQISSQSDSATREYRAFVYETPDHVLHMSSLFPGTATQSTLTSEDMRFLSGNRVVADIHNHPTILPNGQYNAFGIGTDYRDMRALQGWMKYTMAKDHTEADPQLREYIVSQGYVSKYNYENNKDPIPDGDGSTPYPGAVRAGMYPDLAR